MGGTRVVILLLGWEEPDEPLIIKDTGLYICWHT